METRSSLSTQITTALVIIITMTIIVLMDNDHLMDVLVGVCVIGCLFSFALILSVRGVAEYKQAKVIYEVK